MIVDKFEAGMEARKMKSRGFLRTCHIVDNDT